MKPTSPLFDSIRVGNKSAKKKKEENNSRPCQWEGCDKPGTHKAPMGRNREGQFLWMCIDHVREYNKNYNYFSGLDDDAIAKFQKDSITGARPTWEMGSNRWGKYPPINEHDPRAAGAQRLYNRMNRRTGKAAGSGPVRSRKLKALEKKSFEDLNLPATATSDDIKARYKLLVKQNHPDANGGDRKSEERLREVITAYKILQKAGFC